MRIRWIVALVSVGLVLAAVLPIALTIAPGETAGVGTEIRTGAMLGGSYNPHWFYVRTDGGAWQPTYRGTAVEGRLFNFRAANAIFDDENDSNFNAQANTTAFINNLSAYKQHGILAFTVSLQGGNPGYEGALASAFAPDGSLKSEWMGRAAQVIEAADARGQIVILTYFYFRQDHVLNGSTAVKEAVRNATDWLIANSYRNVIIEIANEHEHNSYGHGIITNNTTVNGIGELITLAKSRFDGKGWRLPVSASRKDITFSNGLKATADLAMVHGNGTADWNDEDTYSSMKAIYDTNSVPVVMNEDDNGSSPGERLLDRDTHALIDAINAGGSWGLMWAEYNQYVPFEWSLGDPNQLTTEAGYFHAILDQIESRVFGQSTPPPALTPTEEATGTGEPTAPDGGTYSLQYSLTSDRGTPATLDGATISGDIFGFITPDSNVGDVEFYLDGALVQTEHHPPFDFAGTSQSNAAEPWDTTTVADGEHSVNAILLLEDGSIINLSATFTVANGQGGAEPSPTPEPTATPTPEPTATPTPEPTLPDDDIYSLQYSSSQNRSDPADLDGATVAGHIYPSTTPDTNVDDVAFYLDGALVQFENNAPFDFGSGTIPVANSWNTKTVSDGEHTIEAVLLLHDGSTTSVSATFTVANGQGGAEPSPTPEPTATPTPEPTATPTPEPTLPDDDIYSLQYSSSRTRSDPADLDGATVEGYIYPFVTPDTNVDDVVFYLDGALVQFENNAPFDFGSGTVSVANSWNTKTVSDGEHTIEARLLLHDGSTTSVSATFTVANNSAGS